MQAIISYPLGTVSIISSRFPFSFTCLSAPSLYYIRCTSTMTREGSALIHNFCLVQPYTKSLSN
ncbi:hypothetical protein K438DRAFT_1842945, partial [Mycena galopus ATCC 62051]